MAAFGTNLATGRARFPPNTSQASGGGNDTGPSVSGGERGDCPGGARLEPAFHLEPDQRNDGAEEDHSPAVLIAPSPVVLRHVLEVHAIDSRHQSRWDADDGDYGQNLEHVILSYADQ